MINFRKNTRKKYIFNVYRRDDIGKRSLGRLKRRLQKGFKRVKIIFCSYLKELLIFNSTLSENVMQSHFCIHVVLILYKTDVIIMTHKHFSNIIISRIDTSLTVIFHSLKSLFMFMDHKLRFRKITHDGSKLAPRKIPYIDFIHACTDEEFIDECRAINQMMHEFVTVSDFKNGAEVLFEFSYWNMKIFQIKNETKC